MLFPLDPNDLSSDDRRSISHNCARIAVDLIVKIAAEVGINLSCFIKEGPYIKIMFDSKEQMNIFQLLGIISEGEALLYACDGLIIRTNFKFLYD